MNGVWLAMVLNTGMLPDAQPMLLVGDRWTERRELRWIPQSDDDPEQTFIYQDELEVQSRAETTFRLQRSRRLVAHLIDGQAIPVPPKGTALVLPELWQPGQWVNFPDSDDAGERRIHRILSPFYPPSGPWSPPEPDRTPGLPMLIRELRRTPTGGKLQLREQPGMAGELILTLDPDLGIAGKTTGRLVRAPIPYGGGTYTLALDISIVEKKLKPRRSG